LSYFPDEGSLRRELYPKHTEFFRLGKGHRERLMLAANRVGKTESIGGYEMACHLTGEYPEWWEGRRWDRPVRAWAGGDTGQTVRDIIQQKLVGSPGQEGTGLIPEKNIGRITRRTGVPDAIDQIQVKHASGGMSLLGFKSYDQGRKSWQGTEQDIIWCDEEPPQSVYSEALVRTMTTDGMMILTFTPLLGLSDVVLSFLPGGKIPEEMAEKAVVTATWDDAPHISEEQREALWASIPPFQRDARSKGIPQLGSGAIFPLDEERVAVEPFEMPEWWPRAYALDVGWNKTAALWGAYDRDSDTVYLYSEHYEGHAEPSIHADAIKRRGWWIPGVIDPASRQRGQRDGRRLMSDYEELGLELHPADNAVESGINTVWQRLSGGRLKVFNTLHNWLSEFRIYRRDENGKVVKSNDHLMDTTRYLIQSGMVIARSEPDDQPFDDHYANSTRNTVTGY
jgi:phage terminase large subunit-like protein